MIKYQFGGSVQPPSDMMAAAKASLTEQAFADLMEQTNNQAPTPEQLCKMVDACRQAQFTAELNAIMPSVTMQIVGNVHTKH